MQILVNNIRLFYEKSGSGPPLILLHGNGESHEIFDRSLPLLARTHTVYAVDSRCHGRSENTADLSYDRMAGDMIGFIRQLGLEKPAFYGFSDGGIVGLLIAGREPELLGQLLVSGANLAPEGLKLRVLLAARLGTLRPGDRLNRLMLEQPPIPLSQLTRISVPTVVLAGEHDLIRDSHTRLIARCIPASRLVILPGESHGSYIVHSEKLAHILRRFL